MAGLRNEQMQGMLKSAAASSGSSPAQDKTEADMTQYLIECEQEDDGRWLAEVPELPGVLAYGSTADIAAARAEALALRVLAERLETQECRPVPLSICLAAA